MNNSELSSDQIRSIPEPGQEEMIAKPKDDGILTLEVFKFSSIDIDQNKELVAKRWTATKSGLSQIKQEEITERRKKEIYNMLSLHPSPYVVKLLYWGNTFPNINLTKKNRCLIFVMKAMEKDLKTYLQLFGTGSDPSEGEEPSWGDRLKLILDVAKGMRHLHREGLFHADLKSANVLLKKLPDKKKTFLACVSDVGLSRFVSDDSNQYRMGTGGTRGYIAPERYMYKKNKQLVCGSSSTSCCLGLIRWIWQSCINFLSESLDVFLDLIGHVVKIQCGCCSRKKADAKNMKKQDVYSFGIMLWEVVQMRAPWGNENNNKIGELTLQDKRPCLCMKKNGKFYKHKQCWKSTKDYDGNTRWGCTDSSFGFEPTAHKCIPPEECKAYSDTLDIPPNGSRDKSFLALIEDCWHEDPNQRPSFENIVKRLEYLKNRDAKNDGNTDKDRSGTETSKASKVTSDGETLHTATKVVDDETGDRSLDGHQGADSISLPSSAHGDVISPLTPADAGVSAGASGTTEVTVPGVDLSLPSSYRGSSTSIEMATVPGSTHVVEKTSMNSTTCPLSQQHSIAEKRQSKKRTASKSSKPKHRSSGHKTDNDKYWIHKENPTKQPESTRRRSIAEVRKACAKVRKKWDSSALDPEGGGDIEQGINSL